MNGLVAFLLGATFGMGLLLSGMTDVHRVQGFLDLAGAWDPSLAFVMGGALLVTGPAFQLARHRGRTPWLAKAFQWPSRKDIDARLMAGAILFGAGWGLVGLCPGPAVVNLASGTVPVLAFVGAMVAGMWLKDRLLK